MGSQRTNKWDDYSEPLGSDYQFTVREDRTISIMFQKFLDDAAAHTCTDWIQQEMNRTDRVFFSQIEPDELDLAKSDMVSLRRIFHGQITSVDAPIVDSLVDLHTVVQRSGSLEQAWTSVCILFTHPDSLCIRALNGYLCQLIKTMGVGGALALIHFVLPKPVLQHPYTRSIF